VNPKRSRAFAKAARNPRKTLLPRRLGKPTRNRNVTCTGWHLECGDRAACATDSADFFGLPAPARAPPQVRNTNPNCSDFRLAEG